MTNRKPEFGDEISKREHEVWAMLAEGLTNRQIAERTSHVEQTVKFHVSNLFRKLGVSSRTEAAIIWQGRQVACEACGRRPDHDLPRRLTINGIDYVREAVTT